MRVKQYKQFEKEYLFKGVMDSYLLLNHIQEISACDCIHDLCENMKDKIALTKRLNLVKDKFLLIEYAFYICCHIASKKDFDTIYRWLKENKDSHINVKSIGEIINKKSY